MKIQITESDLARIIKNIISESNILQEVAGISHAARVYTDIIYDRLKNNPSESEFTIRTKEYPEKYKEFPVDNVHIKKDKYTTYDEHKSTLTDIYITIGLSNDENELKSMINHEMKHAYEDFLNRKSSGKGMSEKKHVKKLFTEDFYDVLKNPRAYDMTIYMLFYFYYTISKVEQSAVLENIYDNFTRMFDQAYLSLKRFKWDSKISDDTWKKLKMMNIPLISRFETGEEFMKASENFLINEFEKFKKKINKMKYVHELIIKDPNSNLSAEKDNFGYFVKNLPKDIHARIRYNKYTKEYYTTIHHKFDKMSTVTGETPKEVLTKIGDFLRNGN